MTIGEKRCTFAPMDVAAFIDSGMLGNYCLGYCSPEEAAKVVHYIEKYPVLKAELARLDLYFEEQLLANAIKPPPSLKLAVMQSIYKQQAEKDNDFVPFFDLSVSVSKVQDWLSTKDIHLPEEDFDNLFVLPLPSTDQVTNFIVSAKTGHEVEVHHDFIEYLFVIKGSCTMNFDGKEISYTTGDIITVLPNIPHFAVVTSQQPMLALVQRQMCA